MTVNNYKELVKRIARLARQNQELEENIRRQEKINEKLRSEIEAIRTNNKKVSSEGLKEKPLKFNMATVLYADIHGFSRFIESMDSSEVMDELDEILLSLMQLPESTGSKKLKLLAIPTCAQVEYLLKI